MAHEREEMMDFNLWNKVVKRKGKVLHIDITNLSLSDGLPAKQLAFILLIATSEPFHFP